MVDFSEHSDQDQAVIIAELLRAHFDTLRGDGFRQVAIDLAILSLAVERAFVETAPAAVRDTWLAQLRQALDAASPALPSLQPPARLN